MCVCVFSLFACLLFCSRGKEENRGLPSVSLGVVNEPTAALGEAWQPGGPAIGSHGWAPAEPRRAGRRLEVAFMGSHFGAPAILVGILVGIGMFTGGVAQNEPGGASRRF